MLISVAYIAIDLIIAVLLALVCFWLGINTSWKIGVHVFTMEGYLSLTDAARAWLRALSYPMNASVAFFAVSAVVPTFLSLAILLTALIGEALLSAGTNVTRMVVESTVEKKVEQFAPFTLLGCLCGVGIAVLKAIIHFFGDDKPGVP